MNNPIEHAAAAPTAARAALAKPKERFIFIDGLRAVAALAVMSHHLLNSEFQAQLTAALPKFILWPISQDTQRVQVFFVISGFVIAFSLKSTIVTLRSAFNFILRRQVRLDPVYWLCIFIAVIHVMLQALRHPAYYWPQVPRPGVIALNMLYLQNICNVTQIMSVSWTLCLEVQLYLIYILLLLVIQRSIAWLALARRGQEIAYAIPMGVLMLLSLWSRQRMDLGTYFITSWCVFGMGALVYWTMEKWISPLTLGLFALLIVAWSAWYQDGHAFWCVGIGMLLYVSTVTGGLKTWLGQGIIQYFGRISYSLFLVHRDVGHAVMRIGIHLTGESKASALLWYPLTMVACVAVAHVVHVLVERPSMNLAARLKPRKTAVAVNVPQTLSLGMPAAESAS